MIPIFLIIRRANSLILQDKRGFKAKNNKVSGLNTEMNTSYNMSNQINRLIDTSLLFYLVIHQLVENKGKYIDNNKVDYKEDLSNSKEDSGDLQGKGWLR